MIDPEFCFFGMAAFDLGVMKAHMRMSQQPQAVLKYIDENYVRVKSNEQLETQFEGVEILRRIIGLAQLPLQLTLKEKAALLEYARTCIMGG